MHFTADAELHQLIERARALASHRLPNGDLAGLMKLMAASFVRQEEKRRFGIGANPRRAKAAKVGKTATTGEQTPERGTSPGGVASSPAAVDAEAVDAEAVDAEAVDAEAVDAEAVDAEARHARGRLGGKRSRYVSMSVRRTIHGREQGQCSFVAADGRRCSRTAFLEFDHIEPFARLGAPVVRNIRLLCRSHNLLHARNCFGALHLAAKIAARERSEAAHR